jgi:multicomponent Na+:H+ antiporter subunit E
MAGWLTVVWVALWGDLSVGNILAGMLLGLLLVTLVPPSRSMRPFVRPAALLRLAVVFSWRIVAASAVVAWEVATPRNRINEGIVAVPISGGSDLVVTLVANAVSLTPGTLTLELDRPGNILYVHVLHLRDLESVRRDVRSLEALVVRAFGDADSLASLEAQPRDPGAAR